MHGGFNVRRLACNPSMAIHSFVAMWQVEPQSKDCCKFCHKAAQDFYLAKGFRQKGLVEFYFAANLNFSTPGCRIADAPASSGNEETNAAQDHSSSSSRSFHSFLNNLHLEEWIWVNALLSMYCTNHCWRFTAKICSLSPRGVTFMTFSSKEDALWVLTLLRKSRTRGLIAANHPPLFLSLVLRFLPSDIFCNTLKKANRYDLSSNCSRISASLPFVLLCYVFEFLTWVLHNPEF